jgi:hypothetical protein
MLAGDPNAIAPQQQTRIRSEREKVREQMDFIGRDLKR